MKDQLLLAVQAVLRLLPCSALVQGVTRDLPASSAGHCHEVCQKGREQASILSGEGDCRA